MECSTTRPYNSFVQDMKKGIPRLYPWPIYWNYGYVPQTWENPYERDEEISKEFNADIKGDGDPLDVVEIGSKTRELGEITLVKPLGALAMIDDGEVDWKLITIAANDPLAGQVDDLPDVDRLFPGMVDSIQTWFKLYKTPDGKPENKFAYGGKPQGKAKALKVIEELRHMWEALKTGEEKRAKKIWTGSK